MLYGGWSVSAIHQRDGSVCVMGIAPYRCDVLLFKTTLFAAVQVTC